MAGVYRSMFVDNEKPVVGGGAKTLGVRTDGYDIRISEEGIVRPQIGGLSVAPNWRDLPYFLIPKRLRNEIKDARGSNKLACFKLGEFSFHTSVINDLLVLRPDSPRHGTIEPSREMTLSGFQDALANTRDSWKIDEI